MSHNGFFGAEWVELNLFEHFFLFVSKNSNRRTVFNHYAFCTRKKNFSLSLGGRQFHFHYQAMQRALKIL